MLTFGRLITAVITPFADDGSVDYDTFGRLVSGLVDAGNDAVVVTGTTGESPVLSDDERFNLYREALSAVGDRALVIAGTGGYNTAESVHLSREAAEIGVHGLLQVTPYYNKPPQDGLVLHFETIA
ncbi:MAG: dihydrodipicolinate synthase family protein, partial [Chloroflexi bacterium]|nr:dihydrodipicolinate synthase family protein [Chloroflexota bacterium]